MIHLKDIVKGGIKERFAHLRTMGIKTVMITGDNPLTATAIAAEAGVDDFLAEAKPEDKLKLIRDYQKGGRLVAMTGDGTNDAPALAQADVAVAMNTGTQSAREAANMIDLDSNPTKLLEIVEIGKQLLMTRGTLTTFSIANDVAKYFAIIPAAFATTYPALERVEHHGARHARERDPLGRHLQRADHRRADPARAPGGEIPADERGQAAAKAPVHLRGRRIARPLRRHQAGRSPPGGHRARRLTPPGSRRSPGLGAQGPRILRNDCISLTLSQLVSTMKWLLFLLLVSVSPLVIAQENSTGIAGEEVPAAPFAWGDFRWLQGNSRLQ